MGRMPAMRSLRHSIVLAIALLVPLQGLATVTAGMCMALGHHEAPAMADHAHDGHGEGHSHDAPADPSHCAPCVACCAAAAISSAVAPTPGNAPAAPVLVSPLALTLESPPGSLFRPPLAL